MFFFTSENNLAPLSFWFTFLGRSKMKSIDFIEGNFSPVTLNKIIVLYTNKKSIYLGQIIIIVPKKNTWNLFNLLFGK